MSDSVTYTLVSSGASDTAFSADQSKIFVAMDNGNIEVFDVATQSLVATWDVGSSLGAISLSKDGSTLLVVERNAGLGLGTIYEVNTEDGSVQKFSTPGSSFNDIQVVDQDIAILSGGSGGIVQFDLHSGVFSPITGGIYYSNNQVLVGDHNLTLGAEPGISNGPLYIYDATAHAFTQYGDDYQSSNTGFNWGSQAISEAAGLVLQFIYYGSINVYDLTLKYLGTVQVGQPIDGLAFDKTGTFVYVHLDSGMVEKYSVDPWQVVESYPVGAINWDNSIGYGNQVLVDDNGSHIVVTNYGDAGGSVQLIDATGANDRLAGTSGADRLAGGRGNDTYIINNVGDQIVENPDAGTDRALSSVGFTLPANVENLTLTGTANLLGEGNDLNNRIAGNSGDNSLYGYGGNDSIDGGTGSDKIYGGAGNDTITIKGSASEVHGDEGNDHIYSGIGADLIDGGAGRDIVDYRNYATSVHVDLQAGTGAGGDTIIGVESISGSAFNDALYGDAGNNNLTGNGGDDIIYARDGNDSLTGGAGDDRLHGGLGNDTYYVQDATDIVIESTGEGYDTVCSTVSLTLRANVERLVLNGTSAIDGTGNSADNNITGNSGANILAGLAGNDFIIGGGGADHLDGGEGSDTYYVDSFAHYTDAQFADTGVSGWDILRFAGTSAGTLVLSADDTGLEEIDIATSTGADANFAGTTAINVDASALTSGVIIRGNSGGNLLTGTAFNDSLYGGKGDDVLLGGGGNDVLDGGRGNDTMQGGLGSDDYYVDSATDFVVETAGGGNDAVLSTISFTLGADLENLVLLGSNNLTGTGNALNNSLTGNSGRDTLLGLAGDDFLSGGLENDTLKGGDGSDWIVGGSGQDQFYGEAGKDYFVFDDGDFAGMTTSTADRIHDFSQVEGDQVRLDDVDASSLAVGDQAFSWIGTGVFTNVAGQLRYEQVNGVTVVEGDTNGDGVADFWIRLDGLHNLQSGDFVL